MFFHFHTSGPKRMLFEEVCLLKVDTKNTVLGSLPVTVFVAGKRRVLDKLWEGGR